MITAVIFDLDGTLLNTLPDIADAMNRALRLHDLPEHPMEAYKLMVGNGARKLAERAVGDRQELAGQVLADYQAWYECHCMERTCPYDGVAGVLESLTKQEIRLCVFSNKPDADTKHVVRHYYPQIKWTEIRGQVSGVPVKPDPAGVKLILQALQIPSEQCLFVGDSAVDMETGRASGMMTVGVDWGFRGRKELTEAGADHVIEQPEELVNLINEINQCVRKSVIQG